MRLLESIIKFGALAYVIICILQAVLFPPNFLDWLDNYLFVFALINLALITYKTKEWRIITLAFVLFFLWSLFVEFSQHGMAVKSNLPYLLYFLKWAAILVTVLNLKGELFFLKKSKIFINALFFLIVIINLFLLINPFGYGELLQNIYAPKPYENFVFYNEFQNFRLVGTQMNPNDNAVILSLFYLYYLIVDTKKWYFLLVLVGLILLTQSRTVFVLTAVISIVYFMFSMRHRISKKRLLQSIFAGILVVATVVLSSNNLRSLFTGEAFQSHSIMVRIDNLSNALNGDKISLLFGNGVMENPLEQLGVHVDSEFIIIILQYGLIGLVFWLFIVFALLKQFSRKSNNFIYWVCIVLLILGVSLTNFTFAHGNLGVVIVFFLALVFASSKDEEMTQQINRAT